MAMMIYREQHVTTRRFVEICTYFDVKMFCLSIPMMSICSWGERRAMG